MPLGLLVGELVLGDQVLVAVRWGELLMVKSTDDNARPDADALCELCDPFSAREGGKFAFVLGRDEQPAREPVSVTFEVFGYASTDRVNERLALAVPKKVPKLMEEGEASVR